MTDLDPTVQAALITGGFSLIGILLTYLTRQTQRLIKHSKATRWQVQNSHATNLRDDLDVIRDLVQKSVETGERALEATKENRYAIETLRGDLTVERRERIQLEDRVDGLHH